MTHPKISVVTVCYNAASTIEETIKSVLSQRDFIYEYIIVDGNSIDNTIDIISTFIDNKIKLMSELDEGIYDAMNKGIRIATGDFIIFLGADDKLIPNSLEKVLSYITHNNIIYYGDVIFKPSNIIYDGKFDRYKMAFANICHQAMLFPVTLLKQYEYNTKYRFYSDWVSNMRFIKLGVELRYIPLVISEFSTSGVSQVGDINFQNDRENLILSYLGINVYLYYLSRRILSKVKQKVKSVLVKMFTKIH